MLVDRETGEIKPRYSFGEVVLLCHRIDLYEGLNLLTEIVMEDRKLYPKMLLPTIMKRLIACENRLNGVRSSK